MGHVCWHSHTSDKKKIRDRTDYTFVEKETRDKTEYERICSESYTVNRVWCPSSLVFEKNMINVLGQNSFYYRIKKDESQGGKNVRLKLWWSEKSGKFKDDITTCWSEKLQEIDLFFVLKMSKDSGIFLLWIQKARAIDMTYEWESVWWETKS